MQTIETSSYDFCSDNTRKAYKFLLEACFHMSTSPVSHHFPRPHVRYYVKVRQKIIVTVLIIYEFRTLFDPYLRTASSWWLGSNAELSSRVSPMWPCHIFIRINDIEESLGMTTTGSGSGCFDLQSVTWPCNTFKIVTMSKRVTAFPRLRKEIF